MTYDYTRELVADSPGLPPLVRPIRRVVWLPLLTLAVAAVGAIPVYRIGHTTLSHCQVAGTTQWCRVWQPAVQLYWLLAAAVAHAVIAHAYLLTARSRGSAGRVMPYLLLGSVVSVSVIAMLAAGYGPMLVPDLYERLHPSGAVQVLFRLLTPLGAIGLVLVVLAGLERRIALLLFAALYLAVVVVPIDFGWSTDQDSPWARAPALIIASGVLALGGAGFLLADSLRKQPTARVEDPGEQPETS